MSLFDVQSKVAGGSSTGPTITLDAAPTTGDLLVVILGVNEDAGGVTVTTPPSGYTFIFDSQASGSESHEWMYWKVAGVGESATISATISGSRRWVVAVVQVRDSAGGTWTLDKSAKDNGNSTTCKSGQTGVTLHSVDYVVAGLTNKNADTTQGSPNNGFSLLEMGSQGSGPTSVRTGLYIKVTSAQGQQQTQVSLSTAKGWCGIIAAFKVSSLITGSGSMTGLGSMHGRGLIPSAQPELRGEAAFGYGPQDVAPVFQSITSYIGAFNWQRGRQNELNQTAAGTGTLILGDPTSDWDADNTLSLLYPNIKPGLPIRIFVVHGTTIYPLFYGYVERLPRTLRATDVWTERRLDLIDGFALLANAGLNGHSYSAELSDSRVTHVLDDIVWPADKRQLSVGVSTLQATAFADDDTTDAQQHLLAVADSENGLLFCNGDGDLVFIDRHTLISGSASQATFADI